MASDPKSDVLQLQLSRYHSLDLVRLPRARKYRIVFAERFGIQRRAFVEIPFEAAQQVALFLNAQGDPPVDPFSTTFVDDAAVPEPLEDPSTNHTVSVIHDKTPKNE